jgi:hypothetical protein
MRLLCLLFMLCFTSLPLLAQELRTNAEGEKIIVYPDGSARYFNDLTLIESQKKDSAGAAYPVVAVVIEPLSGGIDPTEADLRRIAERKREIAREAETLARTQATAALNNRVNLETELASARAAGETDNATALQRRLQLAKTVETKALNDRTAAEKRAAATNAIVAQGRYVDAYNEARRRERAGPELVKATTKTERTLGLLLPAEPAFSGFGSAPGRLPVNEPAPCGIDPTTTTPNGPTPASRPSLLFTHTDENLRPFLDGKEYLRCLTWTSRDRRGDRFLHLRLTFANPNAMTSYGFLETNSSLSLHLLNGRHLSLQATRKAVGILDHSRREVNYNVVYTLPRGAAQELQNQPLDYLRIFWSSGYEEYPVYQVDALRKVVECL